jgi:enoyl-CoA hydratase/carnithine racemase
MVLYEVANGVATITFNRPDKLNAFTRAAVHETIAALDLADADDAVRAVIVTGAGRAFCAGADLSPGVTSSFNDGKSSDQSDTPRDFGGLLTLRLFECLKPVIAAVNGPAVGIGATMQLAMDIRLASDQARYGFVFARRGIVPEAASSWFLPRIVGISRALEWSYSGRMVTAQEALEAGLIRSICKPDELLPAAYALAREIADNAAPVSVALTRQMMWRMLGTDHPMEAHKIDSRAVSARGRSADAKEGVGSFLEKRPAHFSDTVSGDMPEFFPWWEPRDFE